MDDEDLDVKEFLPERNKCLSAKEKVKEQNRIRQLAFKAREKMPKDFKSFCLVAAHLVKNAHRYWDIGEDEAKKMKNEAEEEIEKSSLKCQK